jgi:hypothetical protein
LTNCSLRILRHVPTDTALIHGEMPDFERVKQECQALAIDVRLLAGVEDAQFLRLTLRGDEAAVHSLAVSSAIRRPSASCHLAAPDSDRVP